MIRAPFPGELDRISSVLGRANDAPYDLLRVAGEKCFAPGYAGETVVRLFDEKNDLRGISVTCGRALRLLAVDKAYRRRGIGSDLLREAESRAHVVFAEGGNYFTPGVVEQDVNTREFFRKRGYIESRWTWNLETTELPDSIPGGILRATHADSERLLRFIEREFGAIWRFECSRAFDRDVPPIFIAEFAGRIAGFAAHDVNNVGLGFFGPTGVARDLRGNGFGRALLQASLSDLRRLGYRKAVIPWTDALDFYRKSCGAEVTHRFVTLTRDAEAG
jgi:GNAT superfamily N-acetyltransferase